MLDFQKKFFSRVDINPGILEPLHSGIALFDENAVLVYANKAYLDMYRLSPGSYAGIRATDLFITASEGILQVLKTGEVNSCTSITVDGYYGFTNRYPILDTGGRVAGCMTENLSVGLDRRRVIELQNIVRSFQASEEFSTEIAPPRLPEQTTFESIVGESPSMKLLKHKGLRFAQNDEPILILGENGVGKDLVAQAVHAASSRCAKKFIAVNCAALPQDLMESELFGYEPGAFTGASSAGKKGKFEQAEGGTIFLDEIGELPLNLQAKLLRVLENHEIQKIGSSQPVLVDFRLVSATNRDLEQLVERGEFREDLFYRLNLFELSVPPLRERLADIPLIASSMLRRLRSEGGDAQPAISPDVLSLFSLHDWKGNVRELRNVVTYAAYAMGPGETVLGVHHLPERFFSKRDDAFLKETGPGKNDPIAQPSPGTAPAAKEAGEIEAIRKALREARGNRVRAARLLGMARSNLYRKIARYGLEDEPYFPS